MRVLGRTSVSLASNATLQASRESFQRRAELGLLRLSRSGQRAGDGRIFERMNWSYTGDSPLRGGNDCAMASPLSFGKAMKPAKIADVARTKTTFCDKVRIG